ncbi:penicillin-binding protein 2A [Weissella uvarum]|uniref:PBP1A family penicillin-binding protein n=1 Tax=Weissella uvarum TaxID=1479233 RepID=UPI00195F572F|nr:PBP1A family penicillin-binding protein [Weissella uvarum]MBM7617140.1 penicillin-binding protein 2A [Weissella uvarum]MCM0595436.1 PBP1A family penicillin-binding protein [Weissella uvarum]
MKNWLQKMCERIKPVWERYQITRWLIVIFLTLFFVISVLGTFNAKTTDVSDLKARLQDSTTIYDRKGHKAGAIAGEKGTYVKYNQISPNVKNAIIATEDRNFYHEYGFSFKGTLRGALTTIFYRLTGRNASAGGSTITQQLVKNAFLTQDQTITRKVKELFLSIQVEKEYTKNDIITMYMNNAYFGRGAWGVQDAAKKYFGVDAKDLTVDQGAMLAGMLQSPSGYDPISQKENAMNRRNQVLQNMVNDKKLSQQQADQASQAPLGASNHEIQNNNYRYPSYFDAVINEATGKYHIKESKLLNDGYKIYTSLDQEDQQNVQNNFADPNLNPVGGDSQAATLVMDARTGGVRAVEGGRGEHVFRGFNRATQMYRSPGSTIKPIVDYGPALSRGFSYDSMLKNQVTSFGTDHYEPHNALNYTSGDVPMYKAIENSYNIPAVWVLDQIGTRVGFNSAKKAGLPVEKSDNNLSLGIGGMKKGVSPLQMTQAYTSFANDGKMSDGHFITKIVDATGKTVVDAKPKQTRLWSPTVAKDMTQMLLGVYTNGTGEPAQPSGYTVAGKTGTTEVSGKEGSANNATDSWAIAYTPDVVVTTWVGYDKTDAEHTLPIYLAQTAGPLMKQTLEQVLPNTKHTAFGVESVRDKLSDKQTSEQSSEDDSDSGNTDSLKKQLQEGAQKTLQGFNRGVHKVWSDIAGGF